MSSVGAVLHPPVSQEQSPQQAATALPQSVAPQPVAAMTQPQPLAAPAVPAPTMEQLGQRSIDRLLTQLEVLGITQTPTTVPTAQQQPQQQTTVSTTTPAAVAEPQPEEQDPWNNWQATQTDNQ